MIIPGTAATIVTGTLFLAACIHQPVSVDTPEVVDYNYHVKPILSDRCYQCHGPDDAARQAGLELHEEAGAKNQLLPSGGHAIVPGSLRRSKAFRRITSQDPEKQMPPPESNLTITDRERALLARWITQGAEWKAHWSFIPPTTPAIPIVRNKEWPRGTIDRFVLAKMENEGLSPSPQASRERLLRRVTLDLTGLPPSVEEMDAFLADTSHRAYEAVVDRLLADTAYGEHMTTEWLDISRYADTHGYQADRERRMWPWRDWVINAFNANLPFDTFGTWQLAGDLLPDATTEQRLATAFNRNHRQTNEGGSIEEEFRTEYVADRTNTVGTAFLGLTMECARCHDHKYDPITHKDYYSFFSFFNSIDESGQYSHFTQAVPVPALSLPDGKQHEQLAFLLSRVQEAKMRQEERRREANPAFMEWLTDQPQRSLPDLSRKGLDAQFEFETLDEDRLPATFPRGLTATTVFDPTLTAGKEGLGLTFDGENGARFEDVGEFTAADAFTLSLWLRAARHEPANVLIHRTEAALDAGSRGYELSMEKGRLVAQLAHMWPAEALRIIAEEPVALDTWVHVAMTYDGSMRADGLALYVQGERAPTTTVRDGLTRHITYENMDVPLTMGYRFRDTGFRDGIIDSFRLYSRALTAIEIAQLAGIDTHGNTEEALFDYYLAHHDLDYAATLKEFARHQQAYLDAHALVPEIMVMRKMAAPRQAHVLLRGVYDEKGQEVISDVPAALGGLPDALPRNRLGLARWIFSPDNPLTARVAVNRFWQRYFGTGLVMTPEDFGNQGALPSHPELLDYLATTFMATGWDMKEMQRQIVISATYRQSSEGPAELLSLDPENRLLARGPQLRLSAEMLRDQALFASGLLVHKLGGPPAKPYQPAGMWEEKAGISYIPDDGEGLYRRSLYTYFKRTSPPPSMLTFDMSTRSHCVMRRQRTATPMQALVLLNDPQFVEAARFIAERAIREGGPTDRDRRAFAFRLLTARTPTDREAEILHQLYHEQYNLFADDAALSLLQTGNTERDTRLPATQVAAMTMVTSALLSLDEVMTR